MTRTDELRISTCLITSTLSPAAGGLAASVPAMAAALDRSGKVAPHICGFRDPAAPNAWHAWGRRVHALDAYGPAAYRIAPDLARILRGLAPDIVDVQGLWQEPSRVNLANHRRTGTPYVVTPRGMLDPWAVRRSWWKKAAVRAAFENTHLRRAACLRVTAPMEAAHVRAFGLRQPLAVVPNGVDIPTGRRPTAERRSTRRLLFLSRIHPKKGVDYLLRAWAVLGPSLPDWELVVAGPDEVGHTHEMRRLARELAAPRVSWPGPVHGEAKSRLYHESDLVVLPTHAENFGLVVAEALAHEVAVVTTKNAPWQGLETEECGWWIDVEEGALEAALRDAMGRSDDDRAAMGRRGRAWMERDFCWDRVGEDMAEVYRWVIGGGPPAACVITD